MIFTRKFCLHSALYFTEIIFQKYGKPKFVLCAAFTANGDLLTGDSNGNFLIWGQGECIGLLIVAPSVFVIHC